MSVVITIQANLVRINYLIVIFCSNYLHRTRISCCLFFIYIFGYHLIFQAIFQCCRAGYSGAKFKYITVITFEFVRIAGYIRTGTDKGHVSDKYIPQTRQFIQFIVTQRCSEWSDSRVSRNGYSRTIVIDGHCAEFMAVEEFPVFTNTFLDEESRTSRHLNFYHDSYDH